MEHPPIFISYRNEDRADARIVYQALEERFRGLIFWDKTEIQAAENWRVRLTEALEACQVFVAVIGSHWSTSDLANEDDFVKAEIEQAIRRRAKILPIVMPGGRVPELLPERLSEPEASKLKDLLDALTAHQAIEIQTENREVFDRKLNDFADAVSDEFLLRGLRFQVSRLLLSEFSSRASLGAPLRRVPGLRSFLRCPPGQEGIRVASTVFLVAVMASLLSWMSRAAAMSVEIADAGTDRGSIPFGYMTELNAGPAYLVLIPALILIMFSFIGSAQTALNHMNAYRRVRANRKQKRSRPVPPLDIIDGWNQRLFSYLTPVILIIASALVVGTEFRPCIRDRELRVCGDYKEVAFGYIQAPHLRNYAAGTSLAHLREVDPPKINGFAGIDESEAPKLVLSKDPLGGPRTPVQWGAFWAFVPLHVGLECLFGTLAAWFVCKVFFLLWVVHHAVRPSDNYPIELRINLYSADHQYGLGALSETWRRLLATVLSGFLLRASTLITNQAKGSWRPNQSDAAAAPFIGQFLVGGFGLFAVSLFVGFMFSLWLRIRALQPVLPLGETQPYQRLTDRNLRLSAFGSFLCYVSFLAIPERHMRSIARACAWFLSKLFLG